MLKVQEFGSLEEVNHFLQGGIIVGRDLRKSAGGIFVHGLTLAFTSPVAETVTFDAGAGATIQVPLTLAQVLEQIADQTTGVVARLIQGRLALIEATPTSGVAVTGAGTANAELGIGNAAVAGTLFAAPGDAAPSLVSVLPGVSTYIVTTEPS
jgi:hypothetical protein